jgi:hypothetical protein
MQRRDLNAPDARIAHGPIYRPCSTASRNKVQSFSAHFAM